MDNLKKSNPVRVRLAPSPTGEDLHIGNAYTALLNYAFAKKYNGQFIIRLEDTDRTRFIEGSEGRILSSLQWLQLKYAEGPDRGGPFAPYKQSDRLDMYQMYAKELIEKEHAYYCFCTPEMLAHMREEQKAQGIIPKYDRRCLALSSEEVKKRIEENQNHVIRMRIPDGNTTFKDAIRGDITIQNSQLDDQVLIKSDGFPTYHMAVVIDDHLMEITHVIRGEDWTSSTPKHVLLYTFFGWDLPVFAHTPLLRNPDRSKLSKRKNPVWVSWYKEQGFLPEAVVNYLGLMGWSHPEEKEIFSLEEFSEAFTLERVQPVGPIFDIEKLKWMNGHYIRSLSDAELAKKLIEYLASGDRPISTDQKIMVEKIVPLIKERIKIFSEWDEIAGFFFETRVPARESLIPKKRTQEEVSALLESLIGKFDAISLWNTDAITAASVDTGAQKGWKNSELFMVIRIAISGGSITPPISESMEILGKDVSLDRLKKSLALLR